MHKPLPHFEEYIRTRVVEKRVANQPRVMSLEEESAHRAAYIHSMVQQLGIDETNANYVIEACYDCLISLARARLIEQGYYARGEGAHEAEVAFTRVIGFEESEVIFLNELRYRRNRILYYGDRYDREYAQERLTELTKLRKNSLKS